MRRARALSLAGRSNTCTGLARAAARSAVECLRRDFGYAAYALAEAFDAARPPPRNHVGAFPGTRRRNSWHDALACYALVAYAEAADECDEAAPLVSAAEVSRLVCAMLSDYRVPSTGLLRHQPAMCQLPPEEQVQFTCTQAIWAAVGRAAEAVLRAKDDDAAEALGADVAAHRAAWGAYDVANADGDGLLPVANVYGDTRLWCNTEPAAFLLLDRDDFAPLRSDPWSDPAGSVVF